MRDCFDSMGGAFNWDREINTSHPEYYKWTQTIFLMLFEQGWIHQRKASVNWDPIEHSVLANGQVIDGKGER